MDPSYSHVSLLCLKEIKAERGLQERAVLIWLAPGQPLGVWLSVGVWPPSFSQVPIAQWDNSWLVCIEVK